MEEEEQEIVVIGKKLPAVAHFSSGGSSAMFHTVDVNPYFQFPDDFHLASANPNAIVGDSLKGMAAALKALTQFMAPVLPASEETRLKALYTTLDYAGQAVKAGTLNWSDAQNMVASAFNVALDTLGGVGIGVMFAGIGSYVTSLAPLPPHIKGAMIAGVGLFGFAFDSALGDSGIYDDISRAMAKAIFDGVEAVANFLNVIAEGVINQVNPITRQPIGIIDLGLYDPSPETDDNRGADPTWVDSAAFSDPVRYYETVGNTTYGGGTGPGPIRPPMLDPPLAAPPADPLPVMADFLP